MSDHESRALELPALDPAAVPSRTSTSYPEPFREQVLRRSKKFLADAVGLKAFGVNLVRLEPGGWSSQRHWHTREDEMVYVLEGEVVLVTNAGDQVLGPGMVAGFPAGKPDGHHFINRTDRIAVYLEIGDRVAEDECFYSDIDMEWRSTPDGRAFVHRNGDPY